MGLGPGFRVKDEQILNSKLCTRLSRYRYFSHENKAIYRMENSPFLDEIEIFF